MTSALSTPPKRARERQRRLARLELERRMFTRDLATFVRAAWLVLEPSSPMRWNWHHDLICEYLAQVTRGELQNLIINIPPQHTKSRIVTVLWPCWGWAQASDLNWIFSSYSGGPTGLSTKHSIERRQVIESDWYQERWGLDVELAADQNAKTLYKNTNGGQMLATSTGGTVTGFPADVIVIDDPVNPSEARSDADRKTANTFFDLSLSNRLRRTKYKGAKVIIMQRLHMEDLTGHVLAKPVVEGEPPWTVVALPATAKKDERITFPVSGRVVKRQQDEPLDAGRFPKPVLAGLKVTMGSWGFAGQFQQEPTPEGGGIFQRAWFTRFWTAKTPLPAFDELVQSWDCAFKELSDSDFVVGQLWGRHGGDFYLLDQVRDRMSFTLTCSTIKRQGGLWAQADAKLIEDKANGPAVIDTLKSTIPGLIAIEPEGGKISRGYAVQPVIEAGNVVLPGDAPWINDWLHEVCAFPAATNDDQVDSMTQALHRMKTGAASAAQWAEYAKTHDAMGRPRLPTTPQPAAVTEDLA